MSVADGPQSIGRTAYQEFDRRAAIYQRFQRQARDLFRASLTEDALVDVRHWLLGDVPVTHGLEFHRSLRDAHWSVPMFFRTDEAYPGGVVEMQCPGSGWGELQLLHEIESVVRRNAAAVRLPAPADAFGRQLTTAIAAAPIVHHLLDDSSSPAAMRYFVHKTRPAVRYFGVDHGIAAVNCNTIRGHTVFGLWGECHHVPRMQRAGVDLWYDLPPHALFPQKASLALPFWSRTRDRFDDDIRSCILFTSPVLPDGIELPDGSRPSVSQFSRLSRTQRSFFLKYAGTDMSLNWGSKAVFRLSNYSAEACEQLLARCAEESKVGRTWIVQREHSQSDEIVAVQRDGSRERKRLNAKFSGFYGPGGCLGVFAMYRAEHKVHARPDTVAALVTA